MGRGETDHTKEGIHGKIPNTHNVDALILCCGEKWRLSIRCRVLVADTETRLNKLLIMKDFPPKNSEIYFRPFGVFFDTLANFWLNSLNFFRGFWSFCHFWKASLITRMLLIAILLYVRVQEEEWITATHDGKTRSCSLTSTRVTCVLLTNIQ